VAKTVAYRPISTVANPVSESLRPELILSMEAPLVLKPRFEPAVAALVVGQPARRPRIWTMESS
jgi:hypothetical protein